MPEYGGEVEFQAHVSFIEPAPLEVGEPPPLTSPPAPYGSLGPPTFAAALAGRSYRAKVTRVNPLDPPTTPGQPGIYFVETDYDVAMADLDYQLNVRPPGNLMRKADLIRFGSLTDATGRVRGVYMLRVGPLSGLTAGVPDDLAGSIVTLTMHRVNPNIQAP